MKILIADDHFLFREGLARILNDVPDVRVVATVASGEDALVRVGEFKPDVVLLDVNMPGMGGVEAARRLHDVHPQLGIVMLTISEQQSDLFAAIRAGARGYLLKNMNSQDLIAAIQHVAAGEAMIAPAMAVKLLSEFASGAPKPDSPPPGDELSAREREVLEFVARGLSNKEIATQLALSPHTVKAHLRTILDKLHVRSRAEAAAWAARRGINPSG
ncbi:MAG: response regulator transcription factor [Chloroflexi bacterium]|nr:response regulator transcription factor [Chloroflexota bacterium]